MRKEKNPRLSLYPHNLTITRLSRVYRIQEIRGITYKESGYTRDHVLIKKMIRHFYPSSEFYFTCRVSLDYIYNHFSFGF